MHKQSGRKKCRGANTWQDRALIPRHRFPYLNDGVCSSSLGDINTELWEFTNKDLACRKIQLYGRYLELGIFKFLNCIISLAYSAMKINLPIAMRFKQEFGRSRYTFCNKTMV